MQLTKRQWLLNVALSAGMFLLVLCVWKSVGIEWKICLRFALLVCLVQFLAVGFSLNRINNLSVTEVCRKLDRDERSWPYPYENSKILK